MNLICLGYDSWSELWKRNQQMISLLSQKSWIDQVLFLNPEIYLTGFLLRPTSFFVPPISHAASFLFPRRVSNNTLVYTPSHFPLSGRCSSLKYFRSYCVNRVVKNFTADPYVLIVNRPQQLDDPIYKELYSGATVRAFDWQDDYETFATTQKDLEQTRSACEYYLKNSELVVTINDRLTEKGRRYNSNVHTIPNATTVAKEGSKIIPILLPGLTRPIIGYAGLRVPARLDIGLIEHIALGRTEWTFLFVGGFANFDPLEKLAASLPNIKLMKAVPYSQLAATIAAFDVCILPNLVNEHTAGNNPIKLYDYLASGRPIVATPCAGVELFQEHISIAATHETFLTKLEDSLVSDTEAKREARLVFAKSHSWEARVDKVDALLLDLINEP